MTLVAEESAFRLVGKVQHYAWGGYEFIPALIGMKAEPGVPYAEYWMGAHEKAPSEIIQSDGTGVALNKIIAEEPEKTLGPTIARTYGRMPFLFKILDVREMLSIQVHPSKAEAEAGFARENALGIPLDAPERNYKDDNYKPELQVALSDFWLLHGFRPQEQLQAVLAQVREFASLRSIFASNGYAGLYKYVMTLPAERVNELLEPLARRILQQYEAGLLEKSSPDYWAAMAMQQEQAGNYDRGIFSIYFFNLVHLRPGQAIFQDAGVPHAALHGQALEIMANSDNVIRGGLTPKHVDVPELLKRITFQGVTPQIVEGRTDDSTGEAYYDTPVPDFALSRIALNQGQQYAQTTRSLEILLCLDGKTLLHVNGKAMQMQKGECAVIFAGKKYDLQTRAEASSAPTNLRGAQSGSVVSRGGAGLRPDQPGSAQAVVFRAYIPRA